MLLTLTSTQPENPKDTEKTQDTIVSTPVNCRLNSVKMQAEF